MTPAMRRVLGRVLGSREEHKEARRAAYFQEAAECDMEPTEYFNSASAYERIGMIDCGIRFDAEGVYLPG